MLQRVLKAHPTVVHKVPRQTRSSLKQIYRCGFTELVIYQYSKKTRVLKKTIILDLTERKAMEGIK
jgi:hypothetical protein